MITVSKLSQQLRGKLEISAKDATFYGFYSRASRLLFFSLKTKQKKNKIKHTTTIVHKRGNSGRNTAKSFFYFSTYKERNYSI